MEQSTSLETKNYADSQENNFIL